MKDLLKKLAEDKVEAAFTDYRVFSPELPKALKKKIEDNKEDSEIKE